MLHVPPTTSKIAQIFHYPVAAGKVSKELLSTTITQAHLFKDTLAKPDVINDSSQIMAAVICFVEYLNKNLSAVIDEEARDELWDFIQGAAEKAGLKTNVVDITEQYRTW